MKRFYPIIFICFSFFYSSAQFEKYATDAFVITSMVNKFHVRPTTLNDSSSFYIFTKLLNQLDDDKIYFTLADINALEPFKFQLDDAVVKKQQTFLQKLTAMYQQRINETDTMVEHICSTPFNFNKPEQLSISEDTAYAENTALRRIKISKLLKAEVLNVLLEFKPVYARLNALKQSKFTDSIEPFIRKKVQGEFSRNTKRMLQSPGGLTAAVGNMYCKLIAQCFDPHTEYFPVTDKENFESEVGNTPLKFGFSLDENDGGGVTIKNLKPGSPAYKSGQLNTGDKIEAIQWSGKDSIDVSDAGIDEVGDILSASNHDKVTLSIKKADGSLRRVTLNKEKDETNEDESKVKSFILKGNKSIGFFHCLHFTLTGKMKKTMCMAVLTTLQKKLLN